MRTDLDAPRRAPVGWLMSAALVIGLGTACTACQNEVPSEAQYAPAPGAVPSDGDASVEVPPVPEPPVERHPAGDTRPRTVYVPAYSHVMRGSEMTSRALLSILLSVRNVDSAAAITLTHVDYFDTSGHRVRRYLSAPRVLRPLETAEFTVPTTDNVGGSGANFLVYWEGPSDAHSLLTETVMIGNVGGGYVAFTSRGVELDRRPSPEALGDAPRPAQPPQVEAPDVPPPPG